MPPNISAMVMHKECQIGVSAIGKIYALLKSEVLRITCNIPIRHVIKDQPEPLDPVYVFTLVLFLKVIFGLAKIRIRSVSVLLCYILGS